MQNPNITAVLHLLEVQETKTILEVWDSLSRNKEKFKMDKDQSRMN